jgi:hypothetical protein
MASQQSANFNLIPIELITEIATFFGPQKDISHTLDSVSTVFYAATHQPCLQHHLCSHGLCGGEVHTQIVDSDDSVLNPNVHRIFFSECTFSRGNLLIEALRTNTSVHILDFHRCHFEPEGAKQIRDMLITNTTINTLILDRNQPAWMMIYSATDTILEALVENTSILTLDLRSSVHNHRASLRNILLSRSLKRINCLSITIGDQELDMVVGKLKRNTTLKSLRLLNGQIGTDGLQKLQKMLKVNTTLCSLEINCRYPLPYGRLKAL